MKTRLSPHVVIVPLFFLGLLAGCVKPQPTEAQNSLSAYAQSMRSSDIRYRLCLGQALRDPSYVAVQNHFALPPSAATKEQLTDNTMPTDEDAANLRLYLPIQEKCRTTLLDGMESSSPKEKDFYKKFYTDMDAVLIDLIERKISWGESARRRKELASHVDTNISEIHDKMAADWQKQHKNELMKRRMSPETYE